MPFKLMGPLVALSLVVILTGICLDSGRRAAKEYWSARQSWTDKLNAGNDDIAAELASIEHAAAIADRLAVFMVLPPVAFNLRYFSRQASLVVVVCRNITHGETFAEMASGMVCAYAVKAADQAVSELW